MPPRIWRKVSSLMVAIATASSGMKGPTTLPCLIFSRVQSGPQMAEAPCTARASRRRRAAARGERVMMPVVGRVV